MSMSAVCGVTSPEGETMIRVRDVLFQSQIHNCYDWQDISGRAPTNTLTNHNVSIHFNGNSICVYDSKANSGKQMVVW